MSNERTPGSQFEQGFSFDLEHYKVLTSGGREEDLVIMEMPSKSYNFQGGVIIYCDEQGTIRITKDTPEFQKALKAEGYKQESVYVPFTCGEVPADEKTCREVATILGRPYMIKDRDLRISPQSEI